MDKFEKFSETFDDGTNIWKDLIESECEAADIRFDEANPNETLTRLLGIYGDDVSLLQQENAARKETLKPDAAVEAIKFAVNSNDYQMEFLRLWLHGDFDVIRREWPEAPESVFIGADPLYKEKP